MDLPRELSDVFGSLSVLHGERNAQASFELLVRAARVAAPIMRVRGWRVGSLREFFPSSNVLGMNCNRGETVFIRTRRMRDRENLAQEDSVLHTLLHELVHNVHGSHSVAFYALLDSLVKEACSVQIRQKAGVPEPGRYWGVGRALRSSSSSSSSISTSRFQARGKGYLLGGSSSSSSSSSRARVDARTAAARATLTRLRIQDGHSCGTEELQVVAGPSAASTTTPTPTVLVYDETAEVEDDDDNEQGADGVENIVFLLSDEDDEGDDFDDHHHHNNEEEEAPSPQNESSSSHPNSHSHETTTWACPMCSMCNAYADVTCTTCDAVKREHWRCPKCTFVNVESHLTCLSCCDIRACPASASHEWLTDY